jgi:hypothetical protein
MASTTKSPAQILRERLSKLFAMLGSANAGERENARTLIDAILAKNRKSWNDLTELLQTPAAGAAGWIDEEESAAAPTDKPAGTDVKALDVVHHLLGEYLELTPHEYTAIALWVLHSHVFDQFMVTPRLALVSPVRGCGKTTVLALLALLVARGRRDDNITAAAVFRIIDRERCTVLLDEADNLGLDRNGILRSVLNSGHRRGGSLTRVEKGAPKRFRTFAPMAIAAIGILPLPIMHRSLVIHMTRATRVLRRLDENDRALDVAYSMVRAWARDVKLNPDPDLPTELRNRPADNWRVLISIADSFGRTWGVRAREAAAYFSRSHRDEDVAVVLLNDIRIAFDNHRTDRLPSAALVEELIAMDDSGWSEWTGRHDDQQPRRLSPGELARLLAPFSIRPRSIWPLRRRPGAKSSKGYLRAQFASSWSAYCDAAGTASHPRQASKLRRR